MLEIKYPLVLATVCLVAAVGAEPIEIRAERGRIDMASESGAIARIVGADAAALTVGDLDGLWALTFDDGTMLSASEVVAEGAFEVNEEDGVVELRYEHARATVIVHVERLADGCRLSGEVTPTATSVMDFELPALLRFVPSETSRVIVPADGNQGVGYAFDGSFFAPQPVDRPAGWSAQTRGAAGYVRLYGGGLDQRENNDPPVPIRVTPEGREWLGDALADSIEGASVVANRPPAEGQADLVLVDTVNGPYVSSLTMGEGSLVRVGGAVRGEDESLVSSVIGAVVRQLVVRGPGGTIGLLALEHGPERGGWAAVSIETWRTVLSRAARDMGTDLVEFASPEAMMAALAAGECAVILNPYGEQMPEPAQGGMDAALDAVATYAAAGGHWIEVGGYPFHYALTPQRFLQYSMNRPAGFADFAHIEGRGGSVTVYGVQPRDWEAWAGMEDPDAIFIPTRLSCGGDESGGYLRRGYVTLVAPGTTWRSPSTRLILGAEPSEALAQYCADNGITKLLADKFAPDRLSEFKQSVLLYYGGNASDKLAHLDKLPVPTLVHFADYLKGGFDKQYPDHLPPHPSFGTQEAMKELFDRAHELGHWVMPYTNPTWWCDHPRGPTFEAEGEEPLLRTLEGNLSYEIYALNDGFTVNHWHPAVRAANEETVRQFTEDLRVDILFQDQCGARGFRYDTSPASPTPYAYTEGLLSMVQQDSATVPLSTEGGWDGVVNHQVQLCGMSWALAPTEGGPDWRVYDKHRYPPSTWSVFPLAQYIAHDKCSMVYHDLGQFVTNREVLAWTLGLGFSMSNRIAAGALDDPAQLGWLQWIDRVQKSIAARYVGEPVVSFEHDRGEALDDGVMRASYGDVEIVANLSPDARTEGDRALPGFGFLCTAPGLEAGNVSSLGDVDFGPEGLSYVVEEGEDDAQAWVYAEAFSDVVLPVASGDVVDVETGAKLPSESIDGLVRLQLPDVPGTTRVAPPEHLADLAPIDWPSGPPKVGVLAIEGIFPAWTQVSPQLWLDALTASPLAQELGVEVAPIVSANDLMVALEAGAEGWLAIINPYGEVFPVPSGATWEGVLDSIRAYVDEGGVWWETGGFSLHSGSRDSVDGREGLPVGPSGLGRLGLGAGGGAVEKAPEELTVTDDGIQWLRSETVDLVREARSAVNRALPRGSRDIGHTTLVSSATEDFIGGYRLDGWGWFWRIGGFDPDPQVATRVAADALFMIYTHPPVPVRAHGVKRLWHLRLTSP